MPKKAFFLRTLWFKFFAKFWEDQDPFDENSIFVITYSLQHLFTLFLVRLQILIFLFFHFSFPLEKILHGDMCCHPDCNRCPDHLFKHKLKMMKTADALFYYLLPYHMKKKKILHTHILWFDKPPYFLLSSPNYFCFCYLYYYFFFMTTYMPEFENCKIKLTQNLCSPCF